MNYYPLSKVLKPGCALGILLVAMLACYTPRQEAAAEQQAIEKFRAAQAVWDYVPPEAVLLVEEFHSGIERDYAGAGIWRIYGIDRTCEEITNDYETTMLAAGWKQRTNDGCSYPLWYSFYLESGEEFAIYAEPFEGVSIGVDEETAQQFQTTYFVSFRVRIPIE